jgi:positive control factor
LKGGADMTRDRDELVRQYRETAALLRALRTLNTDQDERKLIGGMLSDCHFALEWLRTGRCPGSRRGVERRAGYERAIPTDPVVLQSFARAGADGSGRSPALPAAERARLEEALEVLSDRERECFVLARGEGFSYEDIAAMLRIGKPSVASYLRRAQQKLRQYVATRSPAIGAGEERRMIHAQDERAKRERLSRRGRIGRAHSRIERAGYAEGGSRRGGRV